MSKRALTDEQVITELRKLGRVKRDPRVAAATYQAIIGKSPNGGFFERLGWRPALATLAVVVLVIPAAIDLASGHDPLTSVRGAVDHLSGKSKRATVVPVSPTPAPATPETKSQVVPAQPAPEGNPTFPETQAGRIDQAPVSAPTVTKPHPLPTAPSWLKQTRSRLEQLRDSNPFRLGS